MAANVPVHGNFVNGEWVPSRSGRLVDNRNPANIRDLIGKFQDSDERDVKDAVDAAAEAYRSWRLVPAPRRGEVLYRLGQVLRDRKEPLARDLTREMGKVIREAREEVQAAVDAAFLMAGEGRRLFGQTTRSELPDRLAMSVRQPVGVCGLVTPWSFPMAITAAKAAAALVCGNTVVVKPATDTPLSAVNLARALQEAGLPKGVFNVVTGSGSRVGMPLTRDPRVKVVAFTGSTSVGRTINEACAPAFKRVHLEMGGKNPVIVMDDANLELAVDGSVRGAFGNSGQSSSASSRILVHRKVARKFTAMLAERVAAVRVGDGLRPESEMGPVVDESQLDTVLDYLSIGKAEGARVVAGGRRLTGEEHEKGWFIQPTLFAGCHPGMRVAREEIFGPVAAVVPVGSLEEAIQVANDSAYGLSAAIFTEDVDRAFAATRDLESGLLFVNAPTTGAEAHVPFGGLKLSGNGLRDGGAVGLDAFTEWKAVYVDWSGMVRQAPVDVPAPEAAAGDPAQARRPRRR